MKRMNVLGVTSMQKHPNTVSVLITSNYSNTTGLAWNFFYRLFNVIARALHDRGVSICLSFAEINGPVTILDKDIPFHAFLFDPLHLSLKGLVNLRKHIRRYSIRYIYLTDYSSWHWLYVLLRLWGVKRVVVHNHISVPDPHPPRSEQGIRKIVKVMLLRISPLSADAVYVCSEFVKDRVVRKACYPSGRVTVINHGIDIDRFICEQRKNGETLKIVTVARATKQKGIQFLIEATALLVNQRGIDNFAVCYVGNGPDLLEFKQMAIQFGIQDRFHFLGQVNDTRDILCSADIVVVPSIWGDAYPLSVIEAMAAGKALVATNVGGIPEQIGNEKCAILVPHSSSEALAGALADLIADEAKRMNLGTKARKRAEHAFREERFYKEVITKLLRDFHLQ